MPSYLHSTHESLLTSLFILHAAGRDGSLNGLSMPTVSFQLFVYLFFTNFQHGALPLVSQQEGSHLRILGGDSRLFPCQWKQRYFAVILVLLGDFSFSLVTFSPTYMHIRTYIYVHMHVNHLVAMTALHHCSREAQ
uniref:Uncharacterized protein n=1 Tax=Trypanosoma vivax (strain Y486) TaxID=1055687 RepID=G0U6I5_TRYVY|nr:hypothetical protein TVY486_1005400 [Trypanosoma vivax Y486]